MCIPLWMISLLVENLQLLVSPILIRKICPISRQKCDIHNIHAYIQDQMNISENFKLTAGIRFEMPKFTLTRNIPIESYTW